MELRLIVRPGLPSYREVYVGNERVATLYVPPLQRNVWVYSASGHVLLWTARSLKHALDVLMSAWKNHNGGSSHEHAEDNDGRATTGTAPRV